MSSKEVFATFKKSDDELQIVYGEVYLPMIPDSDGDFMTAEEIRKTAHAFLSKNNSQSIDIEHDGRIIKANVVESFIARDNDDVFVPGSWVTGVHIEDAEVWGLVKSGDLSGYSMAGSTLKTPTEIEMEIPEFVKGETDVVEDHHHLFSVSFDEDGNYLGGITLPAEDGHFHKIIKGTSTEKVNGHSHRFIMIEELVYVGDE